ncbi:hypothetical protein SKAU_G00375540 [Synaphobranchus kaupii]|uniref:DUF4592 domain-containing protein n=1 Tax=Synaphobranchus kaupii TaxID=118154 RepID=A0A9Q1EGW0_SYNKA|nr:hypothetical protein SKAU_G00375540 [Synaphobranchus kaupii]
MAGFYSCLRGENDSSMASGPPDVTANQETAETPEECPGKKKSKFQTFKNFFVKKKRKEAPAPTGESLLKSSQSSDNVNGAEATATQSDADQDSGSKINMGSKAMSHDSVFVSDSQSSEPNDDGLASSQDNIPGKVKSLQLQLKQAIRMGSPPSLICVKKGEDGGTVSEDDGLPCSPPEISTLHTVLTGSSHERAARATAGSGDLPEAGAPEPRGPSAAKTTVAAWMPEKGQRAVSFCRPNPSFHVDCTLRSPSLAAF